MIIGIDEHTMIEFYSAKVAKPILTTQFVKKHRQGSGGYIDFAKVFSNKGNFKSRDPKHKLNYDYIKKCVDAGEVSTIKAFEYVDEGFIMSVSVDKKQGEPNQKWHLLVSFYGQSEIGKEDAIISTGAISCPELWLWMFEVAVDGVNITTKDIEELYKQMVKHKESVRGQWKNNKWWKENSEKYCAKLEKVINGWKKETINC